jgi:hypothetical protein
MRPRLVKQGEVSFPVDGIMCCCTVELEGIDGQNLDYYGADSLQAVNLASNIEPILERLSDRYEFFWESGDPYFEDD